MWQNSLYKEHASDLKYYQWLERAAHVAWQRKYETWEITWFVRWTICEAGVVGGGGGGWAEGLGDFRKILYMYKTDIFLNHTL